MATTVKIGRFQFQKKTKKDWEESEVILLDGELALEADTSKIKIGDGKSSYQSLPYIKIGDISFSDLTDEQKEGLKGKDGQDIKIKSQDYDTEGNTIVTFTDRNKITIKRGKEGLSPIITTEAQEDKLVLKILDKEGEKKADILYGKDGYTPQKGVDYFDGEDGYTPKKGVDYFDGADGVVTIDNLSDEELKRFKDLTLPTLDDDLKRATEFDALQGTNNKRIMTPLTTKKAIEGMGYDEKISEKTSLEDIETAYSDGMIALAHLSDPGKDLVDKEGKLYRGDVEVGVRVKNAGTTYTIPDTVQKARIYFKAQCEEPTFDNYIFFWVGDGTDENQRFVSKLENRTRHYSAEVNLENSHEIVISTVQAWDKTVKVWDFDWKEVL